MHAAKTTLIAALLAVPLIAAAETRDSGVNQRQHQQHDRIAHGVRSGQLTRAEAQGLRTEQRSIRREERQYRSDGVLSRDERTALHRDLNRSSRSIYGEKHDAETRH